MAVSTQVYILQQIAKVVVYEAVDGEQFNYRFYMAYAKQLQLNKGVDQVLLFEFINQEEKPFNITGSTLVFRLINTAGTTMLLEKPMVILNGATGRAKVTITARDSLEIDAQPATYSISRASGNLLEPVYTNADCSARAPIKIVDSVQPSFVASRPLTIPTTQLTNQTSLGGSSFQSFPGWANPYYGGSISQFAPGLITGQNSEYFSSFIEPVEPITTVQLELVAYTGTIKAQGAQNYQSIWFNVTDSQTYLNYTGTIYHNIVGWFPLLRMCFNNSIYATLNPPGFPAVMQAVTTNGVVTDVIVVNPGSGYMAPPLISFIGDGSGATAEATINSHGSVTGVTVTNGGSGYWPIPMSAVSSGQFVNPPSMSGAIVLASTGYVAKMWYR